MASRPVAQQQNRGEAAVPGDNKQKNMGPERKSQRALGNIGNLVTIQGVDGKPLPRVSRPVTRSFCAKILANAEATAADKNKNLLAAKGSIAVDGARPRPEKKAATRNPVPKKDVVKPKPEEVIETSPDAEQVVEKEKLKEKAACGLSNKPKVQIVDIDASNANNDLAVVEYVEDIYKYYKSDENEGRTHNYMDSQPDINVKMRAILIDWLVQVHNRQCCRSIPFIEDYIKKGASVGWIKRDASRPHVSSNGNMLAYNRSFLSNSNEAVEELSKEGLRNPVRAAREMTLASFTSLSSGVLLCTDVAARGFGLYVHYQKSIRHMLPQITIVGRQKLSY
ncbi:hypothetical protein ACS0TY_024964 [Phlomoides rotata]